MDSAVSGVLASAHKHLLFFAMTDEIAERARKIGGTTLHSISDISRHQRLKDNNAEFLSAEDMLADLCHRQPGVDPIPAFYP